MDQIGDMDAISFMCFAQMFSAFEICATLVPLQWIPLGSMEIACQGLISATLMPLSWIPLKSTEIARQGLTSSSRCAHCEDFFTVNRVTLLFALLVWCPWLPCSVLAAVLIHLQVTLVLSTPERQASITDIDNRYGFSSVHVADLIQPDLRTQPNLRTRINLEFVSI